MIWQGEDDKSVPVAHARWWHTKLPAAQLNVLPGEGHVTVLLRHAGPILEAALHWRPPLPGQHGDEPQQEQQEQAPPQQEQEQLVHS